MGGGLESRCVGRVYGVDGAVRRLHPHHPSKNSVQKTICCNSFFNAPDDGHMYPKHVEVKKYINKITLLHYVGISHYYFMRKMHGQTALSSFCVM